METKRCPARIAYRTMADIGSKATCGNPVVTPGGFCRRHDPETAPKRDKRGRILPKSPKHCTTCDRVYDAYCKSQRHMACPNHPDRPQASPSSNLCGPCLMGRPQ